MGFGELLKNARTKAGLTQSDLAEKSGVPIGTIRDYEQGKRDPMLSTARKLAVTLGVSLDALSEPGSNKPAAPAKPGRPRKAEPTEETPRKRKKGE